MADKAIGELELAAQLSDDSLIPVEEQGAAMALSGRLFRSFAENAGAAAGAESAGNLKRGATFTPHFDETTGLLSWTNDLGLPNTDPVQLEGVSSVNGQTGAVQITPIEIGAAINPNLLDNWYFADPINQREGDTDSTFVIDRWEKNKTVTATSEGIALEESNAYIVQTLESNLRAFLNGNTVTLSALLSDGTLFSGTITYAEDGTQSYFFSNNKVQGVKSITNNILFWCVNPCTIVAVKLECGDTQTLAHQENGVWVLNDVPNKAAELMKCLRYFYRLKPMNKMSSLHLGASVASQTANVFLSLALPMAMRINPTVTLNGKIIVSKTGSTAEDAIEAGISLSNPDTQNSRIAIAVSNANANYELGTTYNVFLPTASHIDFDANL